MADADADSAVNVTFRSLYGRKEVSSERPVHELLWVGCGDASTFNCVLHSDSCIDWAKQQCSWVPHQCLRHQECLAATTFLRACARYEHPPLRAVFVSMLV
jgi:hypothetical protein